MSTSFFFYDLETSGINPRDARVMQFAGQRTDMNLQPIGEPVNVLIKLSPDTLPEPDAILLTGITPQQVNADGMSEAEFLKLFYTEVVQPNTIFMGFNSIRFDDKFMHFLNYRNFYDAYGWQWEDGCSKWDLLDVARMTRALKPDGIEWPFAPDGKPTNRLELLTKLNKLDHSKAHDALDDVRATIAVAKLIRDTHPDLFDYLLTHRDKHSVKKVVETGEAFTYTTGRYPSEYLHTSASVLLATGSQGDALVYDLRHDPTPFLAMTVDELAKAWQFTRDPDAIRLPVKTIKYNHCPAVVPGFPKDAATQERIQLDTDTVTKHLAVFKAGQAQLAIKMKEVVVHADAERAKTQIALVDDTLTVDSRLYDGFFGDQDKVTMRAVRAADPNELVSLAANFKDDRLKSLLPLYKARNYPQTLSTEERAAWDSFCAHKLFDGGQSSKLARYFARLAECAELPQYKDKQFILEELQLYGQSIMPSDD